MYSRQRKIATVPHTALPIVSASAAVYDRSIDRCRRVVMLHRVGEKAEGLN
jgi:hypothetical protein